MRSYFIGCCSSKVVILRRCFCGHLSCHSGDMEQQISEQLHRAESTNQQQQGSTQFSRCNIYSASNKMTVCVSLT